MRWEPRSYVSSGFKYAYVPDGGLSFNDLVPSSPNYSSVPWLYCTTILSRVCRQTYGEAAGLPFKTFIWMFEHAFALDHFLSTEHRFRVEHQNSIRHIALPLPGPYRASEQILVNLQTVTLFGKFDPDMIAFTKETWMPIPCGEGILELRKEVSTKMWVLGDKRAEFTKDLISHAKSPRSTTEPKILHISKS